MIYDEAYKIMCKELHLNPDYVLFKIVFKIGWRIGDVNRQKIDIEKACEWLKANDITFTETPSMLDDFRKAMEE